MFLWFVFLFGVYQTMMENSGPTLEFLLSWVKDGRNLIIWDRDNWAQPNPNERVAVDFKVYVGL